jgi:hypothetical protein
VIVKLFGYQDKEFVDSIYVELPLKVRDVINSLGRDGKLRCTGCKCRLRVADIRYTFSQITAGSLNLRYHIVCGSCVAPVQEAINKVVNGREAQQTRSTTEEAVPAAPGAGGGP